MIGAKGSNLCEHKRKGQLLMEDVASMVWVVVVFDWTSGLQVIGTGDLPLSLRL